MSGILCLMVAAVSLSDPATAAVSGVSASGTLGIVSVSINGSVTVTPIGVSSTTSTGSLTVVGSATTLPTGVSSTSALGNETTTTTASATATPTGLSSTSALGSATATVGNMNSAYSADVVNVELFTGFRSASVTFKSDGTTETNDALGALAGINWFTTTTTGIGSNYWVRLTTTASSRSIIGGTITPGTWTALASNKYIVFTNNNANFEGAGTMAVAFATSSGGANLVSAGNITWDVGYTP